jgi:hypothetical protein
VLGYQQEDPGQRQAHEEQHRDGEAYDMGDLLVAGAAAASLGLYVRRWATSATERVSPLGRLRGMTRRLVAGAY